MKLAVHRQGQGEPLVLLHGWGMHSGLWGPVLDRLAEDFELHCIDLPGHGASRDIPAPEKLADWAELVIEQAPRQAIWLGWSLGGLVMQQALSMPAVQARAMVGVCTSPCFVSRADWPAAIEAGVLRQFGSALRADPVATLRRFLALQLKNSEQHRLVLRAMREQLDQQPLPAGQALDIGLTLLLDTDLRPVQPSCPSLWLLGECDTLVPSAVQVDWQRLWPQARFDCLPGAAHAPFLSHSQAFLDYFRAFARHV